MDNINKIEMLINHPYILLKTDSELEHNIIVKWYNTVKTYGPENICAATEIKPNNKQSKFYYRTNNGKHCYVVPLARNLLLEEVDKIAKAWNSEFQDDDFEILWSQDKQLNQKHDSVKEDTMKIIALEAAKRTHNLWLNEKVSQGWKYGTKLDSINKTNPMCMPWDNLSEKYKIQEYRRMTGLIEVLNEMGLKISK